MRKKNENPAESSERSPANAHEDGFTSSPFYVALRNALERRRMKPEELCDAQDAIERRLLAEYGAMFVAAESVRVPPRCVFQSEEACARFQAEAEPRATTMGDARIELQHAALDALIAAREEARANDLEITPRGAVTPTRFVCGPRASRPPSRTGSNARR
jgi:hypothetical protein